MSRRLAGLGALLAAVAVSGGSVGAAPTPFQIPTIVSLTGSGAALGTAEVDSLRLLEDAVNKSGGVRGRSIAFAVQDDQSSPQVALQLASAIVATHAPIMIATSLVGGCNAILPVIAKGPVTYCLSAGMYPPKDSYMFVSGVSTKEALRLQIKFYHDRGWKRLAVIVPNDATGQDFERNLDVALALPENRDELLVARERFSGADVSVSAQIASIKASAPQVVIAWATGTLFGTALHGMADFGLDIPTGTSGGNLNYNVLKQFRAILPKELYFIAVPGIAPEAVPPGPLRNAAAAYFNTIKSAGIPPDFGHLAAWDPGEIIVSTLKTLGFEATPGKYKQYIENLHGFFGASGEYDFRSGDQRGLDGRSDVAVRYDAAKQQFISVARMGSSFSSK